MNVNAQRVYARTLLLLTPRLVAVPLVVMVIAGVVAAVWVRVRTAFTQRGGRAAVIAGGWHWALAASVVATGVLFLVVGGSLTESLFGALDAARELGNTRVGVRAIQPTKSLLSRMKALPGIEGLAVEVYGGPIAEVDETWASGVPPSGVFYGVDADIGGSGLSLWHQPTLAQGRDIQRDSLDEVVVGSQLAERYGLHMHDILRIRDDVFIVVGIREPRIYGMTEDYNWRADVSLEAYRRIAGGSFALDTIALFVPSAEREEDRQGFLQNLAGRYPGVTVLSLDAQVDAVAAAYPLVTGLSAGTQQELSRRARFLYSIGLAVLVMCVTVLIGGAITGAVSLDLRERRERISLEVIMGAGEGRILSAYALDAVMWCLLAGSAGALAAEWLIAQANSWIADSGRNLPLLLPSTTVYVLALVWGAVIGVLVAIPPVLRELVVDPRRASACPNIRVHEGADA
jgi:hypothetical protein